MAKTTDLVTALRCCASDELDACRRCPLCTAGYCFSWMKRAAADKIEELVDRCARYAEEIAVLREEQKRAAAADVAPVVHGRWEPCFDENCRCRWGFGKCSNCGQEYYAHAINHYNYCPNCGAKMDGGDGRDG